MLVIWGLDVNFALEIEHSILKMAAWLIPIIFGRIAQMLNKGCVAQLNSASDFGSEGYRFESCRGHKKTKMLRFLNRSFFVLDESSTIFFFKRLPIQPINILFGFIFHPIKIFVNHVIFFAHLVTSHARNR